MNTSQIGLISLCAVLLSAETLLAFKPGIHTDITKAALATTSRTLEGKTLRFTAPAMEAVAGANYDTDCGGDQDCRCYACQADPSRHFDNESFSTSSLRLVNLKESIIANITAPSPAGFAARQALGQALHTLQDFYAHSTWIHTRHTSFNPKLGRQVLDPLGPSDNDLASASAQTCDDTDHATLTSPVGTSEVTTGYFLPSFDDGSGTQGICYTGAFPGKCRHGDFGATDPSRILGVCPLGISQDRPGRPFYDQANTLATEASLDFLRQILDYNGEPLHSTSTYPAVRDNVKATKALMGIRLTTLGIIMDTSGSMDDIQDQVNAAVRDIVNSLLGTDDEPGEYLLEPFNDPGVGPPTKTADASVFLAALDALPASGGDDCPELPFSGLLEAINVSEPQAVFFLFTDATARDDYLAEDVILAAQQKGIVIKFMLFGSCSPIDPAYQKVASGTGGQVFFLGRSEAANTFDLVKAELRSNPVTMFSATGTLTAPREFVVPVDASLSAATFSVSLDPPSTIKVLRPSGVEILVTDNDVTIATLSTGQIVTVTAPQAGLWKVQIAGSGDFSVAVLGNSVLGFEDFQFTTPGGRPGHSGFFPIFGQPLTGSRPTGMATLSGPVKTATFHLMSLAGNTIQTINLVQGNPEAPADAYTGRITLPAGPFRVVVSGLDNRDTTYQRVFPHLFQGQGVRVSSLATSNELPAGATVTVPFVVQNAGSGATYTLEAADSQRFVSEVTPATLTLAPNASGNVNVTVVVPPNAKQDSSDTVTLTATSTTDTTITNGAAASFTIDATLSATTLRFDPQDVGTTSLPQSVVIKNNSLTARTIDQITASPEFTHTRNCGNRLAAGTTCSIQVTFTPAALGTRRGTITLVDDTMASPRLIVLSGTGTPAPPLNNPPVRNNGGGCTLSPGAPVDLTLLGLLGYGITFLGLHHLHRRRKQQGKASH